MIIYNGFKDNEAKTTTMKPIAKWQGHTIVSLTTRRVGSQFKFRYTAVCECGKKYSAATPSRLFQSTNAHYAKETQS